MKVFIVMPCINLWNRYTKAAIESVDAAMVQAQAHGIATHFLLVDNASTDETQGEAMKRVSELFTYQRNGERWGFQRSVNFGVNKGVEEGFDAILVLNNDIVLHPQAIWRLANRIGKGDIGMATCMDVAGQTQPMFIGQLDPREREKIDEAPHPHFSAFMISAQAWRIIGEMDELYFPAYFEDNDIHYRMKLVGLPAIVHPPAMFYHYGSRTQNEADEKGTPIVSSPMFENSRALYVKKWGGVPGDEKYETPYNDPSMDIRATKQNPNPEPLTDLSPTE